MQNNEKKFITKFKVISSKGWIQSTTTGYIAVGITFEKELGKKSDSLYLPDFEGIEIKCQQRFSNYPLNLFSKALDGPYLYSTNEFLQKYGIQNEKYDKKEIYLNLKTKEYTFQNGYYFKLKIEKEEERIYIETYNNKYQLIEKEYYIDFKSIKEILELKLNTLAHIRASMRMFDNKKYFRYYQIQLYKNKGFEVFLKLLEQDIINTSFICRVSKTKYTEGKNKNKGFHFTINQENINKLFNEIYYYSSDNKKEKTNQND